MVYSVKKRDAQRKMYQYRKEQGLCPRCGATLRKASPYINCEDCRSYYRGFKTPASVQRKRYNMLLKEKKCPRCGKKRSRGYRNKLCPDCIAKLTRQEGR